MAIEMLVNEDMPKVMAERAFQVVQRNKDRRSTKMETSSEIGEKGINHFSLSITDQRWRHQVSMKDKVR
jgi:arylamine N-acetyltransferase